MNNWSREELILAFNLYCKTPFTKINARNKGIIELAGIIGRSTSAVALKLANFARLDPDLQSRQISGMKHGSKGEEEIWNEFHGNWEELGFQSEILLLAYKNKKPDQIQLEASELSNLSHEGKERDVLVKARINQNFFRKTVLASYDNKCCITGLALKELLISSHIIPWSADVKNRLNPRNGLCLNALHDKAFDQGLITVTPDFKVIASKYLLDQKDEPVIRTFFLPYHDTSIIFPQRFYPERDFLKYHNEKIFKDNL